MCVVILMLRNGCVSSCPSKRGLCILTFSHSLQSQAVFPLMDKDDVYTSIYHALTLSDFLTACVSVSNFSSVLLVHFSCATRFLLTNRPMSNHGCVNK